MQNVGIISKIICTALTILAVGQIFHFDKYHIPKRRFECVGVGNNCVMPSFTYKIFCKRASSLTSPDAFEIDLIGGSFKYFILTSFTDSVSMVETAFSL